MAEHHPPLISAEPPLAQRLAAYAHALTYDDLDDSTIERVKTLLIDTIGCGIPSCRAISPTDCSDETSRLNIARRFGSAMISNTDSTPLIYSTGYMHVKV